MKPAKKLRSFPLFIISLLILASIPAVFALFHKGFFVTDDGEWMIIRLTQFYEALRFGEFPVRFLGIANSGYGYPSPNFLYPGFLYLGSLIHILRFGFINTIKIEMLLFIISSGIFTYLWLRHFFKQLASFIGALVFIYSPYHLYDAYARGSVGELMSLAVVPFILWQLERKSILWSALGIGVLLISHNIMTALFMPCILLYVLLDVFVNQNKKELVIKYLLILLLGVGLSAFFWLPALYDLQYTIFSQTKISDWSNYFAGVNLVGLSTYIIFLFVLFMFITKKIVITKHRLTVLLFLLGVISLFFASAISRPFWNFLPTSFIQFPFRFLSVTVLCASFLAAFCISSFKNFGYTIAGVIIVVVGFSSYSYTMPKTFFQKDDSYYATNQSTTTVKNEYMPKWVKQIPIEQAKEKVQLVSGSGSITNAQSLSHKISYNAEVSIPAIIQTNTIYFPGWTATVDGKHVPISYNNEYGVMRIPVASGDHSVMLLFTETPVRIISDMITLLSIVFLIVITSKKHLLFSFKGRNR